jgi:phosphoserine phosphatase
MSNVRNHHYKLAIFDLDGTLTRERSIWEYIHKKLDKWYGFAERYQERFLAGEISYDQFCELDAQVWKGMRVEDVIDIAKTVPFYPGVDELIAYLRQKGLKIALVSSGLSVLSDWVHERYQFDYSVSNLLVHDGGVLTGKVSIQVHYDQKAVWVRQILGHFGIRPEEVIAIGDSLGDLDMLQMAGFSVAFNSSCVNLEQIADVCIRHQSLAEIIPQLPV